MVAAALLLLSPAGTSSRAWLRSMLQAQPASVEAALAILDANARSAAQVDLAGLSPVEHRQELRRLARMHEPLGGLCHRCGLGVTDLCTSHFTTNNNNNNAVVRNHLAREWKAMQLWDPEYLSR